MSYSKEILVAEDDVQYALTLQLALKKVGIDDHIYVLTSSEQVIDYFPGAGEYADRQEFPLPRVLILSFRLPLLDNFKALRWIREHPEFYHIRIILLSGVEYDDERGIAHDLGADCYQVKPSDFSAWST